VSDVIPLDIEITLLEKLSYNGSGNQLTKTIRPDGNGGYESDGSPCWMIRGRASRKKIQSLVDLGNIFQGFGKQHGIALGQLRNGLTDSGNIIVTKDEKAAGKVKPDTIARTREYIDYAAGRQALALIDTDRKGAYATVRERIERLGGLQQALIAALPALSDAYRLVRPSTSSGLFNAETGEQFAGSLNAHTYVAIKDGSDAKRFLEILHRWCWLAGLGWLWIDDAGRIHERSLVDRSVCDPSRIVFEGPPVVILPLKQNLEARRATVVGTVIIDSKVACPDLTKEQEAEYLELVAADKERIAPEAAAAREIYIVREAKKLSEAKKISEPAARAIVEQRCSGVLTSSDTLPWDDPKLAGITVGDILDNPKKYEGKTLNDPLASPSDGVDYGRNKAMVVIRPDNGRPMITSFAFGGVRYWLKYDATYIAAAIKAAEASKAAVTLAKYLAEPKHVVLTKEERERLVTLARERSGLNDEEFNQVLQNIQTKIKLEQMNKVHHVVNHHGKTLVLTWDLEDEIYPGRPIATYRTDTEFCKFYNKWNITWNVTITDKQGNKTTVTVTKPLGDWWWNHFDRKQYGGIVYAPNIDKEVVGTKLNLWRGFNGEPSAADSCQLYLDHLRDNICVDEQGNPVQAYYDYLIGWLAHCVQYPEQQGFVAVALIGDKGTGKTVMAEEFGKLFGLHYIALTNPDHLIGKFNAHMQSISVLLGDECFYAGDPRHESALKTLITSDRIWIEPKGINSYAVKNFLHIILATNQPWAVPAGHDERRYFVLKVGRGHIQDIPYFKAICEQMKNGGRVALLNMLRNLDLTKHMVNGLPFEVRKPPTTDALRDQQARSRKGVDALVEDMLMNGQVLFSHDEKPWICITTGKDRNRGFDHYIESQAHLDLRRLGSLRVKNALRKEWGCKPYHGHIGRHMVRGFEFPTLADMRAAFEKKHGAIAWPTDPTPQNAWPEDDPSGWRATNSGLPFETND
jgi:Family of unknown function (DUF5906)